MAKPTETAEGQGGSFEQSLERLEAIVHCLEDGDLGLSESLGKFEEGIKLLRQCHDLLTTAERKIEILTGLDAEGNPVTAPFDATATFSTDDPTTSRSRRRPGARNE